jgi:heptosyltransferase-2
MPKKIGIFLPNWIGDVVMATPLLRALHKRFAGQAELISIAKPYVSSVLRGTNWFSSTILYDPRGKDANVLSNWGLVREMRRRRFDRIVLLTNSLRTALLAALSGASERVGYARNLRSWLLTDPLPTPRDGNRWAMVPAVDYYLQLGYYLGCAPESPLVSLPLNPEDQMAAESAWQALGLRREEPVVSFHIAGGWGGKATAKAWPLEHFVALARRIVQETDQRVLVLCGPNERAAAAEVVRQADHPRVTSLANIPELPLALTKGCLARSTMLVTTDSGPRHLATALNVPVVTLFGATHPQWTETYHPRAITLFNKLDCGPCYKQHCPLGHHRCMRDLSVERVFAAVEQQLAQRHSLAA